LREAVAVLRERDTGAGFPGALVALAPARGMAGDADGAELAMREHDAEPRMPMGITDIDVALGRAWAAFARGEHTTARTIAEDIGRRLLAQGMTANGALALHDALRIGADPSAVGDALEAAAQTTEGPLIAAMARHARVLAARDFDGILAVSVTFETCHMLLLAAEAATNASRIAASAGLRVKQRDAAVRAAALAARCGRARTPMLESVAGRSELLTLTRREQEVALMASRGLSKREIANTLSLSTRTVGNHINHIYTKLGISSRDELRFLLGGASLREDKVGASD
jgi:DNA-binding CsgD family transcriptional regulator